MLTQCADQLDGSKAHEKVDLSEYSSDKRILQGVPVYEIENSERILNNIITDINNKWLKQFDQTDSVYIFRLGSSCKIHKYGYAKNEDSDLIVVK